LFSLRELRQIEENRVQEEERAVKSAEEARRFAAEEAERRRREAEEAKLREERDAQLQIEQAREGAEREARMRVESAEAAELEASRLQQEMELRRAEVAKTRPTWMLAVTIIAAIAVIIAIPVAFWALGGKDEAKEEQAKVEAEAKAKVEAAEKEKRELAQKVDELTKEVEKINESSTVVMNAARAAQKESDRLAALDKLAKLDQERRDVQRRLAEAQAAAARAERLRGASVSKACQDNPLAKGCM
jgi:colicin import membrane protein